MTKLNEYVQLAEAARIIGVSQDTLRAWAAAGEIRIHTNPAIRRRLFGRVDLAKVLARIARSAKT